MGHQNNMTYSEWAIKTTKYIQTDSIPNSSLTLNSNFCISVPACHAKFIPYFCMNAHSLTDGTFMSFVCTTYDAFTCTNEKKPLSGQSKNVNGHIKYYSTCHKQNLGNLQFFKNHGHHTHSHCLIYFGSVFENYSSLFLSMCVPAEIYLSYTCYRCCKGDAKTRYTACLSSGAKLMASWKPSMYKISNFCIVEKKSFKICTIKPLSDYLQFAITASVRTWS